MTNKPQALDEQMIEEMARALCRVTRADPDASGVDGKPRWRGWLQFARAAHSLIAAKVAELEAGIEAAFVKGADVAVFIANQRQNPQPPTTRQLDGIAELLAAIRAALAPHPEGTDQ